MAAGRTSFWGHVLVLVALSSSGPASSAVYLDVETNLGRFTLALDPVRAPATVENFLAYVATGFYADTLIHRSVPGFVVQGGGFDIELTQKPTRAPITNEAGNGLRNLRGTIAMARTDDPDSATSQFFINVVDNPSLDRAADRAGYAVFGQVVAGMETIDAINALPGWGQVSTGVPAGFANLPLAKAETRVPVLVRTVRRLENRAEAGADQIVEEGGSIVRLDGRRSSAAFGPVAAYHWRQVAGPSVTLSDPASATPQFVTPEVDEDTQLRFELEVTDASGAGSAPATVRVLVQDQSPPVGLWDTFGETRWQLRRGRAVGNYLTRGSHELVQFRGDHGYRVLEGLSLSGSWEAAGPHRRRYRLATDPAAFAVDAKVADALLPLVSGILRKELGRAPVSVKLSLRRSTHRGWLAGKAGRLQGWRRLGFRVSYRPAKARREAVALLNVSTTYRGARASAPSACCSSGDAAANLASSQRFLAANAALTGIRTTPSGLQYCRIFPGRGQRPATAAVKVNYRALLPSGRLVAAGSSAVIRLDQTLPGLAEGMALLRPGGYYRFFLPPALAFGESGAGALVPPNSALIYDLVLIGPAD